MSPWIALFVMGVTGWMATEIKTVAQIPLQTREACANFAQTLMQGATPQVSVVCISTETGETFVIKGGENGRINSNAATNASSKDSPRR